MFNQTALFISLGLLILLVFILPFTVKKVEEELEIFLFIVGVIAVSLNGLWSWHLVGHALYEPIMISLAVLIIGYIFKTLRTRVDELVKGLVEKLGNCIAMFFIVLFLGLTSSLITAIVAALILSEVVTSLKFDRKTEIRFTILACYAIGLGAALTPIGEPLSTIAVAKLKGAPHYADFFYLLKILGIWVIPGVLVISAIAGWIVRFEKIGSHGLREDKTENVKDIVIRAGKVYIFIIALVLLGEGITPFSEKTIALLSPSWLYWVNSVSAVLDNATLAAIEIMPSLTTNTIVFLLMGLLISGGMLIPGNIPNIISASKLNIKSREWATFGLPVGIGLMLVYFILLKLIM
jgi:predicted cation transporter